MQGVGIMEDFVVNRTVCLEPGLGWTCRRFVVSRRGARCVLRLSDARDKQLWLRGTWKSFLPFAYYNPKEQQQPYFLQGFQGLRSWQLHIVSTACQCKPPGPSSPFLPHGTDKLSLVAFWGFPKIRGTILRVPIIRIIVYSGLYWGPPI